MRLRFLLSATAALGALASGGGCLLTLPLDELSQDGPLVEDSTADTVEAAVDGAFEVHDGESDAAETAADGDADGGDADASTCTSKLLDGDETDIDCGGSCPRCSTGRKCKDGNDCQSTNCEAGRCAACPIGMVRVPVGTLSYCVDATEVTNAQYDAFVADVPPKAVPFPAQCKWKADGSFAPTPKPSGGGSSPVRNVDWCDAWAYCTVAGKRLCGAITTSTTSKPPAPFDKYDDPNVGQWRHACSYGASPSWPYGSDPDPTTCNTLDRLGPDAGAPSVVPVRSLTGCIGTPPELNGLYDMSGNVAEWEDSCMGTAGAADICRVRGGSFRDKASASACGAATTRNRGDRQDWVGFRCCRP